jgi:DNA (cytosine-5)-methyltransferase 1
MKYLSLFSGIGGFELGIQQAYVDSTERSQERGGQENQEGDKGQGLFSKARENSSDEARRASKHNRDELNKRQLTCIGYSEIDKYAIQIYEKHFNHKNYGDITKINAKELPDFDLLVGGFPCQSFSIAGKRGGFNDTRGTLFFDIARILREKQPRLLVLENVKGLLSHDQGKTFYTIISTLDELGYDCQWQVLNSKNFGVPQNRERVFIIGHLRGTSRPQVFPIQESSGQTIRQVVGGSQGYSTGLYISRVNRREGVYDLKETETSGTLTSTMYKGIDASGRTGVLERGDIGRTIRSGGRGSLTAKHNWDTVNDGMRIRRLTPTECARLQGFPDNWHEGVSDTQAYKCYGNAVTVNVIKHIIQNL